MQEPDTPTPDGHGVVKVIAGSEDLVVHSNVNHQRADDNGNPSYLHQSSSNIVPAGSEAHFALGDNLSISKRQGEPSGAANVGNMVVG